MWLQFRRRGIGGSDIAAICGISKWRTPTHVYLEKLGEAPEQVKNEAAEWGTRLEPLIAEKFSQENPDWAIIEKKVIYCHPEHESALANLDRIIICPKRCRARPLRSLRAGLNPRSVGGLFPKSANHN